ncbi:hypothetical protein IQ227_18075 [Anabaena aphanizomenioides LEGE 00250]|uniref:Uncharacterized protein n=1 Tax=Sphaerospermopsis aphanizomenoides LEGE 00250 TaxID=2777972 RepID=A0ABR9VKI1_9CYAN|nr:hypothetical protein [Sphaerospermopsis aphanizomenoides]MBE9237885.1 hypothetical protein [Sphaerospermopsis aphanizomenoides LEGE 00250]
MRIGNWELGINNYLFTVTSHQSPVTSHQSPVTSPQSPITNHLEIINPSFCGFWKLFTVFFKSCF